MQHHRNSEVQQATTKTTSTAGVPIKNPHGVTKMVKNEGVFTIAVIIECSVKASKTKTKINKTDARGKKEVIRKKLDLVRSRIVVGNHFRSRDE